MAIRTMVATSDCKAFCLLGWRVLSLQMVGLGLAKPLPRHQFAWYALPDKSIRAGAGVPEDSGILSQSLNEL